MGNLIDTATKYIILTTLLFLSITCLVSFILTVGGVDINEFLNESFALLRIGFISMYLSISLFIVLH